MARSSCLSCLSWSSSRLQPPRLAQGFGPEAIGLLVADKLILGVVVLDLAIEIDRDVGGVASDVGVAGRVGVSFRQAARLHAVEEIADVERRRVAADFLH